MESGLFFFAAFFFVVVVVVSLFLLFRFLKICYKCASSKHVFVLME